MGSLKLNTGLGADNIALGELLLMLEAGLLEFVSLLNQMDLECQVPIQELCNVMTTRPKPAGNGEREVAQMGMMVRTLFKARTHHIRTWCKEQAGHWDIAISGSSALQALLRRKYQDEAAVALCLSRAVCLADISKFFDSLLPSRMIADLWKLGFPPFILMQSVVLHWAPRLLEAADVWSSWVQVSRSCLPGCVTAQTLPEAMSIAFVMTCMLPSRPRSWILRSMWMTSSSRFRVLCAR